MCIRDRLWRWPVSYTHLDVYKRQPQGRARPGAAHRPRHHLPALRGPDVQHGPVRRALRHEQVPHHTRMGHRPPLGRQSRVGRRNVPDVPLLLPGERSQPGRPEGGEGVTVHHGRDRVRLRQHPPGAVGDGRRGHHDDVEQPAGVEDEELLPRLPPRLHEPRRDERGAGRRDEGREPGGPRGPDLPHRGERQGREHQAAQVERREVQCGDELRRQVLPGRGRELHRP